MMTHFALICAMPIEVVPFKRRIAIGDDFLIGSTQVWEGNYAGKQITLVQSGVGKVHAAAATQLVISRRTPDAIISCGTAGGLNAQCRIGDVVVGETTAQHDYGFVTPDTFIPFGIQIPQEDGDKLFLKEFSSDPELLKIAHSIEQQTKEHYQVLFGSVLSGDQVICSYEKRKSLATQFNALAVDMESAAIAQIAYCYQIPFLTVRGISDQADETIQIDTSKIDPNELAAYSSASLGEKIGILTKVIRYFACHPSKFVLSLEAKRNIKTAAQTAATFTLALIKGLKPWQGWCER